MSSGTCVFSEHEVFDPLLGLIPLNANEALETGSGKGQSDVEHGVLNFAAVAVVLTPDADGVASALCSFRLIDHANRIGCIVLASDQLPTPPEALVMVPVDRFEESLKHSRGDSLLESDSLDALPLQIQSQSADIHREQSLAFDSAETVGEECQERGGHFPQRCDILK